MAELANSCCTPTAQATCCEPEAQAACCGESHDGGCGCAARSVAGATTSALELRDAVRVKYAAAARAQAEDSGAG
jgi:hypothetical protein